MAQAEFEAYMQAQCAAIEASGMDPEEWIAQHAVAFRVTYEHDNGAMSVIETSH